jgi:hypothetical protein
MPALARAAHASEYGIHLINRANNNKKNKKKPQQEIAHFRCAQWPSLCDLGVHGWQQLTHGCTIELATVDRQWIPDACHLGPLTSLDVSMTLGCSAFQLFTRT